jgi:hypothetical protein
LEIGDLMSADTMIDLFGNPARSGLRGRPPHQPTDDTRLIVSTLIDLGWQRPRLAEALGITQPTLRRWYRNELRRGHGQVSRKKTPVESPLGSATALI